MGIIEGSIPDGSVVITPAQQYAELRALTDAVKDLSAKVDPSLADLRKDVDSLEGNLTKQRADMHEGFSEMRKELAAKADQLTSELTGLQKWRWSVTGAIALLGTLVGYGLVNLSQLAR